LKYPEEVDSAPSELELNCVAAINLVRRQAEANFIVDVEIWKTLPAISACFPHSNITNYYY
jgi:hypothetical protein